MGQYWFIDTLGSLQYGEDVVTLPEPSPTPSTNNRQGDEERPEGGFGPTVDVDYRPDVPYASERRLIFQRVEPQHGLDYDGMWSENRASEHYLASPELGMVRNKETGGTDLHMRIQASLDDYPSLGTFATDLESIFQNNLIDGREAGWQEFSFRSTNYSSTDPEASTKAKYNYFSEKYETAIATAPETSIPNAYAVSAIAAFDPRLTPESRVDTGGGGGGGGPIVVRAPFDEDVSNHVSLYNKIKIDREVFGLPEEDAFSLEMLVPNTNAYINYVNEWGDQYSNLSFEENSSLELLGKNVIMTYGSQGNTFRQMNEGVLPSDLLDERKDNMPFYIEINAPADTPEAILRIDDGSDVEFYVHRDDDEEDYGDYTKLVDMIGDLTTVWTSHIASVMDPTVSLPPDENELYGFQTWDYYITNKGFSELSDSNLLALNTSRILDYGLDHTEAIDEDTIPASGLEVGSIAALAYNATNNGLNFETGDVASPKNTFDLSRKLILDGHSVEKEYARKLGQQNTILDALEIDEDLQRKLVDQFVTTHYNYRLFTPGRDRQTTSMESILAWTNDVYGPARSYKEAFENDTDSANCFAQTICYGIDKYRGDKETGEYVQTIWVPNNSSELNYIDTQVRYGQKYTYDVHAYKYVFGMDYKYEQVLPPQEKDVVERVGGEGGTLGYIVRWDGAKNLFDKIGGAWVWALVASKANTSPSPKGNYDLFEELYPGGDPSYDGGIGYNYKSFGVKNEKYFTIADLNDLFGTAWVTKPTDYLGRTYPSWDEIWPGFTWGREGLEITADTLPGIGDRTNFVRERVEEDPLWELDPTDFTITQWFKLFFGAGDGGEFCFDSQTVIGAGGKGYEIKKTQQGYPPSHHLLYAEGTARVDGDWIDDMAEVAASWSGGGLWTGFEQPTEWRGYFPSDPPWRWVSWSRGTYTREEAGVGVDGYMTYTDPPPDEPYDTVGLSNFEVGDTFIEDSDGFEAEYKIVMKPATRIVRVPYFTRSSIVLSNPPPPPEVTITPYRAVNDNLLFSFDATFTKQEAVPVAIEPEEEELINGYYDKQGVPVGDKIVFESDDIPSSFQVYRLDSPPNSYSDFAGNKRASISTLVSSQGKTIRVASATYVEKLQPNVKYYYTFRTADFHENVSNPTIVYEIELVDDGGAVYPIIKTYAFPIIETKTYSIPMKKLIEITPSLSQVTANVSQNLINGGGETIETPNRSDLPAVRLGDEALTDPIWDKTFKIRLTSKQTGKKMDFNVTFKTEDERVED